MIIFCCSSFRTFLAFFHKTKLNYFQNYVTFLTFWSLFNHQKNQARLSKTQCNSYCPVKTLYHTLSLSLSLTHTHAHTHTHTHTHTHAHIPAQLPLPFPHLQWTTDPTQNKFSHGRIPLYANYNISYPTLITAPVYKSKGLKCECLQYRCWLTHQSCIHTVRKWPCAIKTLLDVHEQTPDLPWPPQHLWPWAMDDHWNTHTHTHTHTHQ